MFTRPTRRLICSTTLLFLMIAGLSTSALAQSTDTTTVPPWETTVLGKLAGSQAGFQNWAEGGINTVALSAGIEGAASRISSSWQQKHDLRLSLGAVKQDTLTFRKAEDVIRLSSALTYQGDGFFKTFNPTIASTARTQFAAGFNFDRNPLTDFDPTNTAKPPVKVSAFMAPGTFTQTVGLTYTPKSWITERIGIAAKEVVVRLEDLRPLYNLRTDQTVRTEIGFESHTELDKEIVPNVRLKSTLSLFAAFNKSDPPDMIWENLIAMKVNSWLSTNFEFVLLFDRDVSKDVQLKEVFSVGISFILI